MKMLSTAAISAILVLALLLRLPLLNGSFWLDEAAQALESSRPIWQQLDIAYDFQPPLLHIITHIALYVSHQEWWLRLIGALIPGLISIWATYKIGSNYFSKKVGLWSSLLLATNSFHLFYSQELRPYSLPLAFATLSWLQVLNWTTLKKPGKAWLFYACFTLLGLYSSYLYPFLLLSQLVYIILLKRRFILQYLKVSAIWVIGFLPWLPSFFQQLEVGGQVRAQLVGWEQVVGFQSAKSLALVFGKFLFGVIDLELGVQFAASTLLVLLLTLIGLFLAFAPRSLAQKIALFFKARKQHIPPVLSSTFLQAVKIGLLWLIVPLLSAWVISFFIPVLQPKRVLFLLPAFYLTLVSASQTFARKRVRTFFLLFLLAVNIFGVTQYYIQPRLQRENWRNLHTLITQLYPNKSVAVFAFPEPFAPWQWYDQNQMPVAVTGSLVASETEVENASDEVEGYTYVLLFDYLRDLSDPQNKLIAAVEAKGFDEMDYLDQANIGFVRIYGRPASTFEIE